MKGAFGTWSYQTVCSFPDATRPTPYFYGMQSAGACLLRHNFYVWNSKRATDFLCLGPVQAGACARVNLLGFQDGTRARWQSAA